MMKKLGNFLLTLAIAVGIAGIAFNFVFVSIIVEGASMEPTLHDLDYGYMDTKLFRITGIDRFDVVVLDRGHETYYIKRVVGLPGETIAAYGGNLYINGEIIEQPFISSLDRLSTLIISKTLRDNEYYVLGDNRTNSIDSRAFGPVDGSTIVAAGLIRVGTCATSTCVGVTYHWPEWID